MSHNTMKGGWFMDPGTQIWNFSIDSSRHEALCFTENLLMYAKNGFGCENTKPVGGYCISIEKIGPESREFLVTVAASMEIIGGDYAGGGSNLVATVTANLCCLQEKRTEFIYRKPARKYEKCIYIGKDDDSYFINVRERCPCGDASSSTRHITIESHPRLISEAANILLMRYLSLTNYDGSLSLECLTIDGKLETCDYRCTAAEWKKFNGQRLEVYIIERRTPSIGTEISSTNVPIRESKTLMTRQGRILRHDWLQLSYVLRINPLVETSSIGRKDSHGYRSSRQIWSDDFQLMSEYLDKKTCRIARRTNYFETYPETKKLMSDYIKALLFGKSSAYHLSPIPFKPSCNYDIDVILLCPQYNRLMRSVLRFNTLKLSPFILNNQRII